MARKKAKFAGKHIRTMSPNTRESEFDTNKKLDKNIQEGEEEIDIEEEDTSEETFPMIEGQTEDENRDIEN